MMTETETTSPTEVLFQPTERQDEFLKAVLSGDYNHLMYGGAVGGGKTYLLCALVIMLCRIFPHSRWAVVRKDHDSLWRNLIPSYLQLVPRKFLVDPEKPINQSKNTSTFVNGSQILFFAASPQQDKDLNRWKGLEVNGVFIDEANEVPRDVHLKAIERAGRWKPRQMKVKPPPLVVYTCNPALNWVKTEFYDKWKNGTLKAPRFYLPAYATDNPYITDDVRTAWEELRKTDPRWYERFILGNWDLHEEPDQLISGQLVSEAYKRAQGKAARGPHFLGVDVARFGDDETVIAHRIGNRLESIESWRGIDLVRTSNRVQTLVEEHNISPVNVRVDTIGVGAGVADILRDRGLGVSSFIAGAKPTGTGRYIAFRNLRAEAWWHLKNLFKDGIIEINQNLAQVPKLTADLTAPKYKISSEKLLTIESKDDIKRRLGRSTDYGDAVMQAFAANHKTDWLKQLNTR